MSQADLILINSTERAKELGSRGGLVKTEGKRFAAKLRECKKRELRYGDTEWMVSMLQDRRSYAFDLLDFLYKAKNECKTIQEKALIAHTLTALFKVIHGPQPVINVNNNLTQDNRQQVVINIIQPKEIEKKEVDTGE